MHLARTNWCRMRIAAVQHAVPTRRITNDWILERIREYNRPRMTSLQFDAVEHGVRQMLESSGTEVRYRLNEGEKAFDFGVEAARQALDAASVRPQDVDLLIYAGVVRGWLEPATANLFQGALGMAKATCFDVLDACAKIPARGHGFRFREFDIQQAVAATPLGPDDAAGQSRSPRHEQVVLALERTFEDDFNGIADHRFVRIDLGL